MRRLLVIFMLVLLPFQFAWSAASAYCAHGSSSNDGSHFGHHAHVHKGEPKSPASAKLVVDGDCNACHAASAPIIGAGIDNLGFVPSTAVIDRSVEPAFSSAPARAPDRPQWLRLV